MTAPDASFDFSDDHVDIAHIRNDRNGSVAIAHLAPLRQRVVVGLHARNFESGVGLKKGEIGNGAIRIEDFPVDAVLIQGFQSLGRIVDDLRHFFPPAWIVTALDATLHSRGAVANPLATHLAVDHPAVDGLSVLHYFDDLRYSIAPLIFRHPLRPSVAVELSVGVATEQSVFDIHRFTPSKAVKTIVSKVLPDRQVTGDYPVRSAHRIARRLRPRQVLLLIHSPKALRLKRGCWPARPRRHGRGRLP